MKGDRTALMAHSGVAIFFNRFFDSEAGKDMISVRVNKNEGINGKDSWRTVADFQCELKDARVFAELILRL